MSLSHLANTRNYIGNNYHTTESHGHVNIHTNITNETINLYHERIPRHYLNPRYPLYNTKAYILHSSESSQRHETKCDSVSAKPFRKELLRAKSTLRAAGDTNKSPRSSSTRERKGAIKDNAENEEALS